eukprot:TRINITY_DN10186_c0_g3_i3.p1 TRINITY_DN10186_c0_g3~~TRINITY_DN10186_c0_g3_i3.p1  ORF type:complete len:1669 (-),score=309.83 TRINITY_DN10186_c0_g3_i3:316-5322(-)
MPRGVQSHAQPERTSSAFSFAASLRSSARSSSRNALGRGGRQQPRPHTGRLARPSTASGDVGLWDVEPELLQAYKEAKAAKQALEEEQQALSPRSPRSPRQPSVDLSFELEVTAPPARLERTPDRERPLADCSRGAREDVHQPVRRPLVSRQAPVHIYSPEPGWAHSRGGGSQPSQPSQPSKQRPSSRGSSRASSREGERPPKQLILEAGKKRVPVFPPKGTVVDPDAAVLPEEELVLEHVYGFSGASGSRSHDMVGLGHSEFVYAAARLVVIQDVRSKRQRFFSGHSRRVTCLAVRGAEDAGNVERLCASGQEGCSRTSPQTYCCVWRVADCSEETRLYIEEGFFDALTWSADGTRLLGLVSAGSKREDRGSSLGLSMASMALTMGRVSSTATREKRVMRCLYIWDYVSPDHPLICTVPLAEHASMNDPCKLLAHYCDPCHCAVYGGSGPLQFIVWPVGGGNEGVEKWTPQLLSSSPATAGRPRVTCAMYLDAPGLAGATGDADRSLVLGTASGEILEWRGNAVLQSMHRAFEPVCSLSRAMQGGLAFATVNGKFFVVNSRFDVIVSFDLRQAFAIHDASHLRCTVLATALLQASTDSKTVIGHFIASTDQHSLWYYSFTSETGSPTKQETVPLLDARCLSLTAGGDIGSLDVNPALVEEAALGSSLGMVRFVRLKANDDTVDHSVYDGWSSVDTRPPFICSQELGGVTSLAFHPSGLVLAIGTEKGRLVLLSTSQPAYAQDSRERDYTAMREAEEVTSTVLSKFRVVSLAWSPRGDRLAASCSDFKVYLLAVTMDSAQAVTHLGRHSQAEAPRIEVQNLTLSRPRSLAGNASVATCLQFSACSRYLMSNSVDRQILFWEAASGRREHSASALCNVEWFSGEGGARSSAGCDQHPWRCILGWPAIGMWSKNRITDQPICEIKVAESAPSSSLCAYGDRLGRIALMRFPAPQQNMPANMYVGHSSAVSALKWRDDGTILTVACSEGLIFQWRVQSGLHPPSALPLPERRAYLPEAKPLPHPPVKTAVCYRDLPRSRDTDSSAAAEGLAHALKRQPATQPSLPIEQANGSNGVHKDADSQVDLLSSPINRKNTQPKADPVALLNAACGEEAEGDVLGLDPLTRTSRSVPHVALPANARDRLSTATPPHRDRSPGEQATVIWAPEAEVQQPQAEQHHRPRSPLRPPWLMTAQAREESPSRGNDQDRSVTRSPPRRPPQAAEVAPSPPLLRESELTGDRQKAPLRQRSTSSDVADPKLKAAVAFSSLPAAPRSAASLSAAGGQVVTSSAGGLKVRVSLLPVSSAGALGSSPPAGVSGTAKYRLRAGARPVDTGGSTTMGSRTQAPGDADDPDESTTLLISDQQPAHRMAAERHESGILNGTRGDHRPPTFGSVEPSAIEHQGRVVVQEEHLAIERSTSVATLCTTVAVPAATITIPVASVPNALETVRSSRSGETPRSVSSFMYPRTTVATTQDLRQGAITPAMCAGVPVSPVPGVVTTTRAAASMSTLAELRPPPGAAVVRSLSASSTTPRVMASPALPVRLQSVGRGHSVSTAAAGSRSVSPTTAAARIVPPPSAVDMRAIAPGELRPMTRVVPPPGVRLMHVVHTNSQPGTPVMPPARAPLLQEPGGAQRRWRSASPGAGESGRRLCMTAFPLQAAALHAQSTTKSFR